MTAIHETHHQVIYQMGNLFERINDRVQLSTCKCLAHRMYDDILRKIGNLYEYKGVEQQLATRYNQEAYRLSPTNVNSTIWVANHYTAGGVGGKARNFEQSSPTNTYFMLTAT